MTTTEEKSAVLIDALPYIDPYDGTAELAKAESLIKEEMAKFLPKNYLAHLPTPNFKFSSDLLNQEFARVAAGKPLQAIDTARYTLKPPAQAHLNDPKAWKTAIDQARIQLEHQNVRNINLELSNAYGANAWIANNNYLNNLKTQFSRTLSELQLEIDNINKHRKTEQLQTGAQLCVLTSKWEELVQKNIEIQIAAHYLELHLADLKQYQASTNANGSKDS